MTQIDRQQVRAALIERAKDAGLLHPAADDEDVGWETDVSRALSTIYLGDVLAAHLAMHASATGGAR